MTMVAIYREKSALTRYFSGGKKNYQIMPLNFVNSIAATIALVMKKIVRLSYRINNAGLQNHIVSFF